MFSTKFFWSQLLRLRKQLFFSARLIGAMYLHSWSASCKKQRGHSGQIFLFHLNAYLAFIQSSYLQKIHGPNLFLRTFHYVCCESIRTSKTKHVTKYGKWTKSRMAQDDLVPCSGFGGFGRPWTIGGEKGERWLLLSTTTTSRQTLEKQ